MRARPPHRAVTVRERTQGVGVNLSPAIGARARLGENRRGHAAVIAGGRHRTMGQRKNKAKKAKASPPQPSSRASLDPPVRRRFARGAATVALVAGVIAAAGVGLPRLDAYVHAKEQFAGPPRVVLVDVPAELEAAVREYIELVIGGDWTDPTLCRRVADRLGQNGWVQRVDCVRRLPDARVEARCRYRTPFALVQIAGEFVLVDREAVRLPGRYPYSPSLPLVQGVAGAAPGSGETWSAPDLAAGLAILTRLAAEPFANQVTAVLVHNYGGRRDRGSAHIELATDRPGGRIIWGSGPGNEIEENTAAQKMALLRRNYELHGRIDAGLPVIDVSTFPDRFTTPAA